MTFLIKVNYVLIWKSIHWYIVYSELVSFLVVASSVETSIFNSQDFQGIFDASLAALSEAVITSLTSIADQDT